MNDKDNAPESLSIAYPYLHLYTTIISKVIGERIATIIAATSNPTSLTLI
jgi:hypothetical protein